MLSIPIKKNPMKHSYCRTILVHAGTVSASSVCWCSIATLPALAQWREQVLTVLPGRYPILLLPISEMPRSIKNTQLCKDLQTTPHSNSSSGCECDEETYRGLSPHISPMQLGQQYSKNPEKRTTTFGKNKSPKDSPLLTLQHTRTKTLKKIQANVPQRRASRHALIGIWKVMVPMV